MTPAEKMLDGIDVLCTDENFKDSSEKYMINVTKEKPDGKADLDKYVQGAVLGLFPKVGSEIFRDFCEGVLSNDCVSTGD